MTNELTDQELLDLKLGGQVVREMTALTFLGYISSKVNGAPAYSAANQELVAAVRVVPMGRVMPDEEKVRLLRKLQALNITL